MLQNRCKKSGVRPVCNSPLQAGDVLLVNMIINICGGGDTGVPHEVLRGFEVDALSAQVGTVGVPQVVRGDRRIKGMLDYFIAVELCTGLPIAGTVEAAPHPAQMG